MAGWPPRMSRPLAVKGGGACSKHVLNTRLAAARTLGARCHAKLGSGPVNSCRRGRLAVASGRTGTGLVKSVNQQAPCADAGNDVADPFAEHATGELDRLFRQRAEDVAAALRSRVADRDAVWDAVQEAFARFAALSPGRRSSIVRPDAYLFRTGAHLLAEMTAALRTRLTRWRPDATGRLT